MRAPASILPLRVENLAFEAEGKSLLGPLSFELPRGGITAIIGPNGAGKSLLLRLCHGLIAPASGRVNWPVEEGMLAGRKRHAMVFQRPVMLRRSARANLQHAASVARAGRRVEDALEHFGLASLAERPARLLSGGEQQRLALARAWLLEPEVLFLDEPTSQLDPGATRQIEASLERLAAEGVTLLMTTHDLGQARRLARRVLFLHHGALVEDAEASAFFAAPRSEKARSFLAGDLLW
ncbi:MAG: ATP-binding cassette domain-containing protein [Methylobacterium sp.]|nr:ATP-binding cassette domain-containing protein [Methylobacterium sp.]MCA3652126.1 ATP-binding cassette domain-containing protein [Methylobacterium sp.]MCA4922289.1 ATP-binding cassette domain-containing protein [Methylobacterium sp.]